MSSPSGFNFKKIVPKVCDPLSFEDLQQITSNSEMIWSASSEDGDYKKISSCAGATIAISNDGSIWGWGMNRGGYSRGGGRLARYMYRSGVGINKPEYSVCCPTQIVAGSWKDISMSPTHAAAIKCDGTLWTWGATGRGDYGNLGFYFSYHGVSEPTQTVIRGDDWKFVSSGYLATAAIKTDGTLWSWGETYHGNYSYDGQFGTNYFEPRLQFVPSSDYSAIANTELIASNVLGAASLTESNDPTYKNTKYWPSDPGVLAAEGGRNSWWELTIPFNIEFEGVSYNKIFVNSQSYITIGNWPGYVEADTNFRGIGWNYRDLSFSLPKIYLGASSSNYCKRIFYGVEGTAPNRTYRVRYETMSSEAWEVTFYEEFPSRIDIQKDGAIPSGYTTVTNDKVYYQNLGFNDINTALGTGGIRIHELSFSVDPVSLANTQQWKNVSSGFRINAGIKNDGTLWMWGFNRFGETGTLSTTRVNSPVQTVAGGTGWKSVSIGQRSYGYSVGASSVFNTIGAIKEDGTLWMWGHNVCGVLGAGVLKDSLCAASSPIQTAAGGTNWKSISVSTNSVKATKCDGTMWTWGTNNCYANGLCNSLLVRKNKVRGSTCSPIPVDIAGSKRWKCVNTSFTLLSPGSFPGFNTTCICNQTIALDYDGNLWGWGANPHASLGLGIFAQDRNNICMISYYRVDQPRLLGEAGAWSANVNIESTDSKISTGASLPQSTTGMRGKAAIKNDGTLWTWGMNNCGRLGDNTTITKSSPVQTVAGGTNWKSISNSMLGASALKNDGTLWAWGRYANLCTAANFSSPIQMTSGGTNWNQISEYNGTIQLRANIRNDGSLWLSSRGTTPNRGSLGNDGVSSRSSPVQTVAGGTNWKEACVQGCFNVAATKTDGTLWLWGNGSFGNLGNNNTINMSSPIQTISGGTNWRQITGNACTTLATKTDGTLWSWGSSTSGGWNCGCYYYSDMSSPVQTFAGGTDWQKVTISAGTQLVNAIKCDGSLWWWGYSSSVGSGIPQRYGGARRPQLNHYVTNVRQISYGSALTEEGNLYGWGWNINGQAGFLCRGIKIVSNNNIEYTETLVDIADEFFTREQFTKSGLWATGWTDQGSRLGSGCRAYGTKEENLSVITQVDNNFCWEKINSYGSKVNGIKCDGTLWTWGTDSCGALGLGLNITRSFERRQVGTSCDWSQVANGWRHTSGIKCDGSLWSWGSYTTGANGLNINCNVWEPTLLDSGPWKVVAADFRGGKAIKCDGTLWLWGQYANGRLGNDCITNSNNISSPIQTIAGGTNWCAISDKYQLAIKTDGTLWVWGDNYHGQLATNNTINRSSPVQTVAGGTNWKQTAAYWRSASGLKHDGTLWLWGRNYAGQLGNADPERVNRSSPVQTIVGGTTWRCIVETGNESSFAIKTDGSLWGWGRNTFTLPAYNRGYSLFGTCPTDYTVESPIQICNGLKGFWKSVSAGNYGTFIGIFESEADDL